MCAAAASPAHARPREPGALQAAFAAAARRYHVPESVLLGVAYMESRWDTHKGRPSVSGGYGPMHLTDAQTAIEQSVWKTDGDALGDPRGDGSRPMTIPSTVRIPELRAIPAALQTADQAAALTGIGNEQIREDPAENIAGGAALLAAAQRELKQPVSDDPGQWFGAVARYSGADDASTAADFAADVFQAIRDGESRVTDTGERVTLAPEPRVKPLTAQTATMGLRAAESSGTECPSSVACEWVPAPYEKYGRARKDYGDYDVADRPSDETIDYIVIHDTESTWDTTMRLVQNPKYLGWHFTVRSIDGHIAEHMHTKDVGWHAGNWYVNAKSIGVEHEGFLADPDAWYTEEMYRASARLVRYLAHKYDIPLDRQHILGHDNVPGMNTAGIKAQHTDPGPYWDWAHYFELLGAPFRATADADGGEVTIDPSYEDNEPRYTGCGEPGKPCSPHGSDAVRLYTEPRQDAPLVDDVGLHGDGPSTEGLNDVGARASTGQQYAVAGRDGDWTAIWYLGQKAWFYNPWDDPAAVDAQGWVARPRPGVRSVPVYGMAYPERSAYPRGVRAQPVTPLPYAMPAGQSYVIGGVERGEYFSAKSFDPARHKVVRGKQRYYEIQFGHRVAFVKVNDVTVAPSRGTDRVSPAGTSSPGAA
ncbi:N-acetylmuramoyl-L-alanine amidase [Streptomyces sp. RB6PN25]|uniref:N-acetylmuramoyl-L-alanine amidase n=1 Tax=Streptomyces humicola TaxID=2953240 RepID=A0ABT1Q118_9ACTN|nr:peptidoglycan recognition family protein [Streptomyces humicola]MCQ4083574.1 N-acetylmuramoyl-L-alanine amidase [Streptomyces humicola]